MSRAGRKRYDRIWGFPPIAQPAARVLVLGSMPSVASLAAGEYYAHPRNQFWPITGVIFGFDAKAPYARRREALRSSGIALWDVLASCVRVGSLDSAIDDDSIEVNDFAGFLASHQRISRVCFNGRKAESTWHRHARQCPPAGRRLEYRLLPSTSPAHAGMSYRRKLGIWRSALQC
ncbi:MAG: DNA-deoxyinosine glycosylase [Steroidobacteraceae bacterium]